MGLGGKKRSWVGEQGSRWAELQRGGSDLGGLSDTLYQIECHLRKLLFEEI